MKVELIVTYLYALSLPNKIKQLVWMKLRNIMLGNCHWNLLKIYNNDFIELPVKFDLQLCYMNMQN